MNISDFARERNIEPQAVTRYINRHPEIKKHTSKVGRSVDLHPEALQILEEVYPLPKPVQIIQGVDPEEYNRVQRELELLHQKYESSLEKIALLQSERVEDQRKIAQMDAQRLLLEDKEKQLREEKERADIAEQRVDDLKNRSLWERIRNK